jgi:uncharacterized protein
LLERLRRLMPTREAIAQNRWLRWLGPSLLHPRLWHFSRRGVALGAAIGVFFAFITPVAQIPMAAAVSVALRSNVAVAVVATLVNTPPTFAPVYYAAWRVGCWVLGEPLDAQAPHLPGDAAPRITQAPVGESWHDRLQRHLRHVGKPLLLGALLFALVFSTLSYVAVNAAWHLRVRLKRRRRLRRAAAQT